MTLWVCYKKDREWIYRLNSDAGYDGTVGTANGTAVSGNNRFSTDKFIPTNWSDHPTGISEYGDTEYASWRDFDNATSKWGAFHAPIVWSLYLSLTKTLLLRRKSRSKCFRMKSFEG